MFSSLPFPSSPSRAHLSPALACCFSLLPTEPWESPRRRQKILEQGIYLPSWVSGVAVGVTVGVDVVSVEKYLKLLFKPLTNIRTVIVLICFCFFVFFLFFFVCLFFSSVYSFTMCQRYCPKAAHGFKIFFQLAITEFPQSSLCFKTRLSAKPDHDFDFLLMEMKLICAGKVFQLSRLWAHALCAAPKNVPSVAWFLFSVSNGSLTFLYNLTS